MRFLIIPAITIQLYDNIVEDRPLGGTETGVVRLAHALTDLGAEVTVVTRHPNPPLSNPLYLPIGQLDQIAETDVMIVLRDFAPFFWNIRCKKRYYWVGDSFDQPITIGLGDKRIADLIDGFLAVSSWQADTMCKASGFPENKAFVIGNGVHLPYFLGQEQRQRHRLIYSSTPYRGLSHLLRLFPFIQAKVPQVELRIFSGFDVYANSIGSSPAGYEAEIVRLRRMQEVAARMAGVSLSANVLQKHLAKEFQQATVLSYPNTFEETSCITAMEAIAAGCIPLTSSKGALPETVGECGVTLDGTPGEEQYDKRFVEECVSLLIDDNRLSRFTEYCRKRRSELSWETVAKKVLSLP